MMTTREKNLQNQSCNKKKEIVFFLAEPVAFRRVYGLEAYSRTSRESNHHRQSVSAVKVPHKLDGGEGNLARGLDGTACFS